jgi:ElaB/YqjD/DUF883 family membrane-anchored ribosome-binding protein
MNMTDVREKVGESTHAWQEKTQALRERAQGMTLKARDKVQNASATADLYVREYAWTTVAIAAVAAGFIGYLLGRRRD